MNIYNGTTINVTPLNTNYWREITVQGLRGESGGIGTFEFEWNSAVTYNKDAIVVYGGSWWISTVQNRNNPPASGSQYWNQVLSVTTAIYPVQPDQPVSQAVGEIWFREL